MPATTAALLLTGSLAGLTVAVPVGPFSLLCIGRSLRGGFLPGFGTGLGGATATATGAAVLLFGLHHLLPETPGGGRVLAALGGLMLLWSAVRTVRGGLPGVRQLRPDGNQAPGFAPGFAPAFLSGLAFNAANPLALALLLAALSPVLDAGATPAAHACLLVAGLALSCCAWYAALCLAVNLLRARIGTAVLRAVNLVAGGALASYAVVALANACGG